MTNSANLPAPYGGVDSSVPTAALKNPYCQTLLNFNVTQAGIVLRNGDSMVTRLASGGTKSPIKFHRYGDTSLFFSALNNTTVKSDVYNAATGALVYSSGAGTQPLWTSVYFDNYLFLLSLGSRSAQYDGTTWGGWGYSGYASETFTCGTPFKQRLYLGTDTGATYYYSGIASVAGALTKVDLGSVLTFPAQISSISPLTLSDNVSTDTLLSFVFTSGEILFYQGSYPDSANWTLLGRAFVGRPNGAAFSYQGDVLVPCRNGLVSLRDLFLRGTSNALSLSVNGRIQRLWSDIVSTYAAANPGAPDLFTAGVWDSEGDRIIVMMQQYLSNGAFDTTRNFYFVYDTIIGAWYTHVSAGGVANGSSTSGTYVDIAYYSGAVYLLCGSNDSIAVFKKEGATGFTDKRFDNGADNPYDYTFLSAPIPFPKTAAYETTQIEPIMLSDLYAQTNWNLVADFGRQTSGNQQTEALTTSVAKPAVNVGMQNITYVQAKMSGTTVSGKTVGLSLYSYNVWYNSGETGSR